MRNDGTTVRFYTMNQTTSSSDKDERIIAYVDEDEKEWVQETADMLGIGQGALVRLVLRRVRHIGDGDVLSGLARLQFDQEQKMVYAEDQVQVDDDPQ